jgi:predicted lipoprotein with Yx(FWY)xxD motif
MRPTYPLFAALVGATALGLAGCGGSAAKTGAASSSTLRPVSAATGASAKPIVTTAKTALGTILVDGHGRTLYRFAQDTAHRSMCSGACAVNWPPFTASSKPSAGGGVHASALSLVKRSDGRRQVRIAGHPLYRFKADTRPGQVNGQGIDAFGGTWSTVSASGTSITRSAGGAPTPAPAPTSTGSAPGYGAY